MLDRSKQEQAAVVQLDERKIHVDNLRTGMFVHRLDRDWLGLPFPLEGFLLDTPTELDVLRKHCDFVYVDVQRSRVPILRGFLDPDTGPDGRRRYANRVAMAEELPFVRLQHARTAEVTAKVLDGLRAGGKLQLVQVEDAVVPVVESVLRHADAFLWVNMLKKRDRYEYAHAMNNSLLAVVFGRHLGMSESTLVTLATGGLLLDIGKTAIPTSLLVKSGPLTDLDMTMLRGHVEQGLNLVAGSNVRDADVVTMIQTHHERYDGSGYPNRLVRNQIPLYGRMAGIIDTFDAMTSDRSFRKAVSPHQALQQMYRWGDRLFQRELVEQFMQCLSVYPTGSLIELSNGEVAVVMAQNATRRLKPRIMVLTDSVKRLRPKFIEVDLLDQGGTEVPREIARALEHGAYGLDPVELCRPFAA